MAHLDIPLTVGFFLIVTGALTWLFIAIAGFWFVIDGLERLIDRLTGRERPVTIRVIR
jgi:hypothetical protein